MGRTILLNYPCAIFVLLLCVVNLSNQTAATGLEESFKELRNLILGKWADLDYKISAIDKRLRRIDNTIEKDIKQKINDIEAKVEEVASGQKVAIVKYSEDPINQIKTQTTEILGEIKQIKIETTLFNTVVNSLNLTSNSISNKLENIGRELTEGIQGLKTPLEEMKQINPDPNTFIAAVHNITLGQTYIKESINASMIKLINQDRNICVAAIDNITLGQIELKQSLNATLEEINDLVIESGCVNAGGVKISDQCLIFNSGTTLSWTSAKLDCSAKGQQLASLSDPQAVVAYMKNNNLNDWHWIGGSDATSEGTWVWLDGHPLGQVSWHGSEPDGGTNSNCLMMDGDEGFWDHPCTDTNRYICSLGNVSSSG